MRLRIIYPTGEESYDEVTEIYLRNPDGALGILERHVPYITVITPGELRFKVRGEERRVVISGGVLRVRRVAEVTREVVIVTHEELRAQVM